MALSLIISPQLKYILEYSLWESALLRKNLTKAKEFLCNFLEICFAFLIDSLHLSNIPVKVGGMRITQHKTTKEPEKEAPKPAEEGEESEAVAPSSPPKTQNLIISGAVAKVCVY